MFCKNIPFLIFLITILKSLEGSAKEEGYIYRRPQGPTFEEGSNWNNDGNPGDLNNLGEYRPPEDFKNNNNNPLEYPTGDSTSNDRMKREVLVSTPLGQLRGQLLTSRSGEKYGAFRGIPYAEKTERFQVSKAVKSWDGIKDAIEYSPVCPQFRGWNGVGTEVIGDEDCLYLSVFYPDSERCLDEPEKLPVLFHIHGGAFVEGSGGKFGPDYFMDECIVFVSINYRLGALGFVTTDDGRIPGNLGLKDQLLALKWTRDNIESFRGDKDRVTIMGISAGGASVSYLIASPAASGLFSQAISGSGSSLNPWSIVKNPGERARDLGRLLNCPNVQSTLELKNCFTSKDVKDIVTYQERAKKWNSDPHSISPTIELPTSFFDKEYEPFQTTDPYLRLRDGEFNKVPLITGFVNEEGIILKAGQVIMNDTAVSELNSDWNRVAPIAFYYDRLNRRRRNDVSKMIRDFYFGNKSISQQTFNQFANLHSDRNLNYGILKMADLHSRYASVYTYVFNYTGDLSFTNILLGYEKPVNSHADDFLYLFRIPVLPDHERGSEDEKVSLNFVKLWTSFVKQGEPVAENWTPNVHWTEYRRDRPVILKMDKDLDILGDYLRPRRRFWDHVQLSLGEYPLAERQKRQHTNTIYSKFFKK